MPWICIGMELDGMSYDLEMTYKGQNCMLNPPSPFIRKIFEPSKSHFAGFLKIPQLKATFAKGPSTYITSYSLRFNVLNKSELFIFETLLVVKAPKCSEK